MSPRSLRSKFDLKSFTCLNIYLAAYWRVFVIFLFFFHQLNYSKFSTMCNPPLTSNFKIGYKNMQGLHNKNGCKINDCAKELYSDIEILSETWGCNCEKLFAGYDLVAQSEPVKNPGVRKGRKSGGIMVLCKKGLLRSIKVLKISKNFIWIEVYKNIMKNLEKNVLIVSAYVHDITSAYFEPSVFENLSDDITHYCDMNTPLIITGDLNSRTGTEDENYDDFQADNTFIETNNASIALTDRKNCDSVVNSHGKNVLDICRTFNLKIMNGRSLGDPLGNFTYHDMNLGSSAIDYGICNQNFYDHVNNFMVLPQNELSDHCQIITELNYRAPIANPDKDNYNWIKLNKNFKWNKNHTQKFTRCLENSNENINEIKQRIEAGLIESSGNKIQEIFSNAAKTALVLNKDKKVLRNTKKWFNTKCYDLKKETRRLGRQKHKQPSNLFLLEQYRDRLREYKRQCQRSRYLFWNKNLEQIENSLHDPKEFWEKWNRCSEQDNIKSSPDISGYEWFNYFSNLHGHRNGITAPPTCSNTGNPPSDALNKPFTKDELLFTIKKREEGKPQDMIEFRMKC